MTPDRDSFKPLPNKNPYTAHANSVDPQTHINANQTDQGATIPEALQLTINDLAAARRYKGKGLSNHGRMKR